MKESFYWARKKWFVINWYINDFKNVANYSLMLIILYKINPWEINLYILYELFFIK